MAISFIVPVYNVRDWLRECLDSIVSQIDCVPGSEIIAVNDGSTDDSPLILQEYAEKHSFIKVINQQNGGLSSARNTAIAAATCDYLWCVDSDDMISPGILGSIAKLMKEMPDADFYIGRRNVIGEPYPKERPMEAERLSRTDYLLKFRHFRIIHTMIVKRKVLIENKISFIDEILFEDRPWYYMLLSCVKDIVVMNQIIYQYRINREGSITSKIDIRVSYDLIKSDQQLLAFTGPQEELLKQQIWREVLFHSCIVAKSFLFSKEFSTFLKQNSTYIKERTRGALPPIGKMGIAPRLCLISPRLAVLYTSAFRKFLIWKTSLLQN